jgi:hypothetical protein
VRQALELGKLAAAAAAAAELATGGSGSGSGSNGRGGGGASSSPSSASAAALWQGAAAEAEDKEALEKSRLRHAASAAVAAAEEEVEAAEQAAAAAAAAPSPSSSSSSDSEKEARKALARRIRAAPSLPLLVDIIAAEAGQQPGGGSSSSSSRPQAGSPAARFDTTHASQALHRLAVLHSAYFARLDTVAANLDAQHPAHAPDAPPSQERALSAAARLARRAARSEARAAAWREYAGPAARLLGRMLVRNADHLEPWHLSLAVWSFGRLMDEGEGGSGGGGGGGGGGAAASAPLAPLLLPSPPGSPLSSLDGSDAPGSEALSALLAPLLAADPALAAAVSGDIDAALNALQPHHLQPRADPAPSHHHHQQQQQQQQLEQEAAALAASSPAQCAPTLALVEALLAHPRCAALVPTFRPADVAFALHGAARLQRTALGLPNQQQQQQASAVAGAAGAAVAGALSPSSPSSAGGGERPSFRAFVEALAAHALELLAREPGAWSPRELACVAWSLGRLGPDVVASASAAASGARGRRPLLEALMAAVVHNLPSFQRPSELVVVAYGFARLRYRMPAALLKITHRLARLSAQARPRDAANAALAMARLDFLPDGGLLAALPAAAVLPRAREMKPQELSNLLYSYARLAVLEAQQQQQLAHQQQHQQRQDERQRAAAAAAANGDGGGGAAELPPPASDALAQFEQQRDARDAAAALLDSLAPVLAGRLRELSPQDLALALWSYGALRHPPPLDSGLLPAVCASLAERAEAGDLLPAQLGTAVKALARVGWRPEPEQMRALARSAGRQLPRFRLPELCHFLWGCAALGYRDVGLFLPAVSRVVAALQPGDGVVVAGGGQQQGLRQQRASSAAARLALPPVALNTVIHACDRLGLWPQSLVDLAEMRGIRLSDSVLRGHQRRRLLLGAAASQQPPPEAAAAAPPPASDAALVALWAALDACGFGAAAMAAAAPRVPLPGEAGVYLEQEELQGLGGGGVGAAGAAAAVAAS